MSEELHKSYGFALKQWDELQAENKRLHNILEQISKSLSVYNMSKPKLPHIPTEYYPGSALPDGDKFSDV